MKNKLTAKFSIFPLQAKRKKAEEAEKIRQEEIQRKQQVRIFVYSWNTFHQLFIYYFG